MQTTSFKPNNKPIKKFIRKLYKGNSYMIGIPRKIVDDLNLQPEDYVHLVYINDQLIVSKVPDLEESQNVSII